MPRPVTLTDRRVALRTAALAALAVPALTACDVTDNRPPRSGSVRQTGDASAADQALVSTAARQIAGARAAATKLARHDHAHRSWLLGLAALHQQHLHRLGLPNARPSTVTAGTTPALVSAERRLQGSLVSAAGGAESGALAQVLAAMAAAVAQRLVSA